MTIKRILSSFMREVLAEMERNPEFAHKLEDALNLSKVTSPKEKIGELGRPAMGGVGPRRAANRRAEAVLDPVQVARTGEEHLRHMLSPLSLTQLLDIVAEFGMDTGKLVMKWKDPERVIDRIVEIAMARSQKGDAFRGTSELTTHKAEQTSHHEDSHNQVSVLDKSKNPE